MENNATNKGKTLKIVKLVVDILFYIIIVGLVIFSIANIKKNNAIKDDEYAIPNAFGRGYLVVQSNSMAGSEKDSFTTDDLILVKVINDKNRDRVLNKIEKGDIITFVHFISAVNSEALDTHRVVDIVEYSGLKYFITLGDYEKEKYGITYSSEDYDPVTNTVEGTYSSYFQIKSELEVRGVYTGKLKGWADLFNATQEFSFKSFLIFVVPVLAFFIYELVFLIIAIQKAKQAKNPKESEQEMEARLRAEIEAKIAAEIAAQNANNNSSEEQESKEE